MKTVFVGLSGGVDSSVSAALLQQQGYNVVGVYMKNWTADVAGVACPWRQDLADARAAAAKLDIPFQVFDFQAEYRQHVVDVMVAEYQAGRTPNPDILCNQEIKFKLFLQSALAAGADLIATGHYARTEDGRLLTAADTAKDQTYFLYRVTPEALERTLFPLAGLAKPEVRRLATKFGLPTAKKPDSQGICFIGEVGLREFLSQYITATAGPIVDAAGHELGQHQGAVFYTIGQRHGLGLGGGEPYYVTGKDMATNTVYVTTDPVDAALETDHCTITDVHWIGPAPQAGRTYQLRSRHRAAFIDCTLEAGHRGTYAIKLAHPERALTPGQSAVIYDGQRVLGGGIVA
ncbi:MAG TPA: tRNA 2-thiouridine(34) synthase MnmA [Candidatus Saccharimonadia bacterium]|nr:tRNA 2-thiouridine(34) synthase MnmA [Candidatus Saccharimonadia bacterium]